MSEHESGQDKTEEPTEEKLRKAREEGQLARSKELQSAALVLGGGLLLLSSSHLGVFAQEMMTFTFTLDRQSATDPNMMVRHLTKAIGMGFMAFLPFFIALWLMGALSGMIPGGMNWSVKAMMPQAKRMNPISGIKKIFSSNSVTELVKSILKVLLMLGISLSMLYANSDTLLSMNMMSLADSLGKAIRILSVTLMFLGVGLLIIAAIDVPYQLWTTKEKQKMTKQEVKDEHKNNEGSPELKQKIRNLQIAISQNKINQRVPEADVIIVNPTHYSVALKYDPDNPKASAPYVVAKGCDEIAHHIRTVAKDHGKPVVEVPDLTRAIYYSTNVDQLIPDGLYTAVAYVLRYVFELNAIQARRENRQPSPLPELPIPESLRR